LLVLKQCHAGLGAILFQHQASVALDALETPADVIEAGGIVGFEIGPFLEVIFRFWFAAEHQVREAAEIVGAGIIGSAFDGLRQLLIRAVVIAGKIRMDSVAVKLGENRRIVSRDHGTAQ